MISSLFLLGGKKLSTYSEDYLEMRCRRASGGISELFEDGGIYPREPNVVDNVVRDESCPIRLPLRDGCADLSWIAKDVIQAQISLHAEDVGEQGMVLEILSYFRVVDKDWDVQRF